MVYTKNSGNKDGFLWTSAVQLIQLSHLCGSSSGSPRFYNRRQPQIYGEDYANEPYWPQSKLKPSATQPPTAADKITRTVENRCLNRISVKGV